MAKRKLFLRPNGDIVAMLDVTLDANKNEFGDAMIKRASHLNFNPTTKRWEAYKIGCQQLLASASTRAEAVKKEVEILEKELKTTLQNAQ